MSKRRGSKEGSIFQRQDGRWCGIISLGWQGGRRVRKSYYADTQAEVLEKIACAKNDLRRGLPITTERQTVAQFLDHWLADSIKPSVRTLTHEQYSKFVRLYLAPVIGGVQLAKLSPMHVQRLRNGLLERGLSPRTVQLSLVILRHALDRAVQWSLIARNVAKLVDLPKVERGEVKPFTPDEARRFVDAVKPTRWAAAYITALTLGLRSGELLGLLWKDIDLDAHTVRIVQTVQRTKAGRVFARPKTDRSRRTLTISDSLAATLRAHRIQQIEQRLAAGPAWKDMGLVFTSRIGTAIEVSGFHRTFKRILRAADLPNIRIHDLRHGAASLLLAMGVHPRAVMEQLGHSRISITMDTYSHVMPAMMQDVAEKMDAILNRK